MAEVKPGERCFAQVREINADSLVIPKTPLPGALGPRLDEHSHAMSFERMTDVVIRETMRHYQAAVE